MEIILGYVGLLNGTIRRNIEGHFSCLKQTKLSELDISENIARKFIISCTIYFGLHGNLNFNCHIVSKRNDISRAQAVKYRRYGGRKRYKIETLLLQMTNLEWYIE